MGAGVTGHSVFLLREIHVGPRSGRPEGGNDNRTTPTGKSDLFIVAVRTNAFGMRREKLSKVSGAKGERD